MSKGRQSLEGPGELDKKLIFFYPWRRKGGGQVGRSFMELNLISGWVSFCFFSFTIT